MAHFENVTCYVLEEEGVKRNTEPNSALAEQWDWLRYREADPNNHHAPTLRQKVNKTEHMWWMASCFGRTFFTLVLDLSLGQCRIPSLRRWRWGLFEARGHQMWDTHMVVLWGLQQHPEQTTYAIAAVQAQHGLIHILLALQWVQQLEKHGSC